MADYSKPWQVKYSPDSEMILIYILKDDGEIEPIAYLDTPKVGTPEFDEAMKRAKIMAAGPEMFEALEEARGAFYDIPDWPDLEYDYELDDKLKAAITKATEE